MDIETLLEVLKAIAANPDLLKKFEDVDLPNINFQTRGGKVFWNNLAQYNGWRIQQHTITKHCRILDPNDKRRASGGEKAMERIFKKLADNN